MIEKLKHIYPLAKEKWALYETFFKKIDVPAKTLLLKEGDIAKKAYYIEKGCIRVCFNNQGKDVTFQFFFENERVSSSESFKKNVPSSVSIETIEPCTLWVINKKDLDRIISDVLESPGAREKFLSVLQERNIHYMKHCLSFVKDTPAQRYLHLIKQNPHIVKRIQQHYIASYLGISTVHLSRIKSSLIKKNKVK